MTDEPYDDVADDLVPYCEVCRKVLAVHEDYEMTEDEVLLCRKCWDEWTESGANDLGGAA